MGFKDRGAALPEQSGITESAAPGRGGLLQPAIVASALSLACVQAGLQSMRITTLTGIYPVEASLLARHVLSALVLVCAFFFLHKRGGTPHGSRAHRAVAAAAALAASCAELMKYSHLVFGVDIPPLASCGRVLEEPLLFLLLAVLSKQVLDYGIRQALPTMALSILILAPLQYLLSFLQSVPCMVAVALLPLAAVCAGAAGLGMRHDGEAAAESAVEPDSTCTVALRASCLGILVFSTLLSGAALFESLDFQQTYASSSFNQLCIFGGNAIAGAVLLMLDKFPAKTVALQAFVISLFALCALDLYLTTFVIGKGIGLYLSLSSVTIKATLFLAYVMALLPETRGRRPQATLCLGLAANSAAQSVSSLLMLLEVKLNLPAFDVASSLSLIALFACCVVFSYKVALRVPGAPAGGEPAQNPVPAAQPLQPAGAEKLSFAEAVSLVAREHMLTSQEEKVLLLLARGKNAKSISDELFVSVNTTKSHMRKIYAKLGVHSQQEIIALVSEAWEEGLSAR